MTTLDEIRTPLEGPTENDVPPSVTVEPSFVDLGRVSYVVDFLFFVCRLSIVPYSLFGLKMQCDLKQDAQADEFGPCTFLITGWLGFV